MGSVWWVGYASGLMPRWGSGTHDCVCVCVCTECGQPYLIPRGRLWSSRGVPGGVGEGSCRMPHCLWCLGLGVELVGAAPRF